MRDVAIVPQDFNPINATSSRSYDLGGTGNSLGILYSADTGAIWQEANGEGFEPRLEVSGDWGGDFVSIPSTWHSPSDGLSSVRVFEDNGSLYEY